MDGKAKQAVAPDEHVEGSHVRSDGTWRPPVLRMWRPYLVLQPLSQRQPYVGPSGAA